MARSGCARRSAGFLLIEVAVALIIVAMAFGYAFRSLSGGLDRLGRNHNSSAALLLAQSTLDRVGYDIPLGQDEAGGTTQQGFAWSVQTAPYSPGQGPSAARILGYVVRVSVSWKERGNARQVLLSTVRLAYPGRS